MWLFKKTVRATRDKSDEEILALYRESGDKTLFAELFKNHVGTVYGSCMFYLHDKEEAKDAVMQIFEKLMTELKKRRVENFKNWLGFVVRNHCISELRKKNTARTNTKGYYEFEYTQPDEETEQRIQKVNDEQMLQMMQESLPELKENQRKCVELFYLRDLSYRQVSEMTGLSENEVKSCIQNGKRNLKLMIEEKQRNKK